LLILHLLTFFSKNRCIWFWVVD